MVGMIKRNYNNYPKNTKANTNENENNNSNFNANDHDNNKVGTRDNEVIMPKNGRITMTATWKDYNNNNNNVLTSNYNNNNTGGRMEMEKRKQNQKNEVMNMNWNRNINQNQKEIVRKEMIKRRKKKIEENDENDNGNYEKTESRGNERNSTNKPIDRIERIGEINETTTRMTKTGTGTGLGTRTGTERDLIENFNGTGTDTINENNEQNRKYRNDRNEIENDQERRERNHRNNESNQNSNNRNLNTNNNDSCSLNLNWNSHNNINTNMNSNISLETMYNSNNVNSHNQGYENYMNGSGNSNENVHNNEMNEKYIHDFNMNMKLELSESVESIKQQMSSSSGVCTSSTSISSSLPLGTGITTGTGIGITEITTGITGNGLEGFTNVSGFSTPSFMYSQNQYQYQQQQQQEQEPEQEQELQQQQQYEQIEKQREQEKQTERYQKEIEMQLLKQRESEQQLPQQQQPLLQQQPQQHEQISHYHNQQLHYPQVPLPYEQTQYPHPLTQPSYHLPQQPYLQQQDFFQYPSQQLLHHRPLPQHLHPNLYRQPHQQQESGNDPHYPVNIGRWTVEEHELFLKGLKKYGRNWKLIQKVIHTRSATQIRTHAQKFFTSDHYKANKRGRYISRLKEIETYDIMKDLVEQGTIPLTTLEARNITNCMNNCKRRININNQSSQQQLQHQHRPPPPPRINTNIKRNENVGEMKVCENGSSNSNGINNFVAPASRPKISVDNINVKRHFDNNNNEPNLTHDKQRQYEAQQIRWNGQYSDIQNNDTKQPHDYETRMIQEYHRQSSSSKISPLYSDLLKHLNKDLSPLSPNLTRNNSTNCKNNHNQPDMKIENRSSANIAEQQHTGCINNILDINKNNVEPPEQFYNRKPFDIRTENLCPRPQTRSEEGLSHYMKYGNENHYLDRNEAEMKEINKQFQNQTDTQYNENMNTTYSHLEEYHLRESHNASLPSPDHNSVATTASIMLYKNLNSSSSYWLHNRPSPSSNRIIGDPRYTNGNNSSRNNPQNEDERYCGSSSKGENSMVSNRGSMVVDMSVHPTITFRQSTGSTPISGSSNYLDSTAASTLHYSTINAMSTAPSFSKQLSSGCTDITVAPTNTNNSKANMSLILGEDRMMKPCSPLPLTSNHREFKTLLTEELINSMNLWSEHSLHQQAALISTQNEINGGVGNHNANNLLCEQPQAYHPYQNHGNMNDTQSYSNEIHRYPGSHYQSHTVNTIYMTPQLMNTNAIYAKQGIYLRAISTDVPSSDTLLESPTGLQSVFSDAETNMHVSYAQANKSKS